MADDRMAEVERAWADCMADAGHPGLAVPDDAEAWINNQLNAIWEAGYSDVPVDAPDEEWLRAKEAIDPLVAGLTTTEIELAVVDFDCRAELDYEQVQDDVLLEYQREFYERHKEELDAWRDAAVAARG